MRQKAANWAGGRGKPGVAAFGHLALLYDTWCFSTLVELSSLGKCLCVHGHL